MTVAASVEVTDASKRTKAIKITGNKLANTIIGGSGADYLVGGAGNDSLIGNASNDKLYGEAGNDIFICKMDEAGTDTIFDYESGDILQILNANGSKGSFSGATFSGNKLTLSIDGGGSVIFSGVSKGNTFNINGKIYTLRGSKFK